MSNAIHFGTSGWRGVIGDDFTFSGVRQASRAIAAHLLALGKHPHVLVGHDTRFLSPEFARASAEILRDAGCDVSLSAGPTPTPALAFEIRRIKAAGAINITASHNPADYNGLKFSGPDGGPALPEVTKDIEARAARASGDPLASTDYSEFKSFDPRGPYLERLAELVRFDVIREAGSTFVCDALHGCGFGYLDRALSSHGIPCTMLRTNRDVLFDGSGPDPSEENLKGLRAAVISSRSSAGLATDGDADRYGILDSDGSFISPNYILGLLYDYLIESRGVRLDAARSIATSHLVDAVAALRGLHIHETPVGFKYIGALILGDNILIGGEESAGISILHHLPEKDGILACLLVAEMIAARRTPLRDQVKDLFRRVGREFWPVRENIRLSESAQSRLPSLLGVAPANFAGHSIARSSLLDGLQLILDDGSWVLVRPSGTEPLVRVYTEAATIEESQRLASHAREWIGA
jgi:phosphoglucomutase